MTPILVLSAEEMSRFYGDFYRHSTRVELDAAKVPKPLWPLLPYAQFWGLDEDTERDRMVKMAPGAVQLNLKGVVAKFDDDLDACLSGAEAQLPSPSREYVAFTAMRMAADFV